MILNSLYNCTNSAYSCKMIKKTIAWAIILLTAFTILGIFGNKFYLNLFIGKTDIPLDLITILVGSIAFIIYSKQKDDRKRDAANILFIEITNAETIMKTAKENLEKKVPSEYALSSEAMSTESWSKYKYLFVKDFERLEWDAISDFYNKAQLFNQAVNHNKSFFQKNEEQIRVNLERTLTEFVKKNPVDVSKIDSDPKEEKKWQNFIKLTTKFYDQFMKRQDLYFYKPDKPIIDAQLCLNNANLQISATGVGTKLKKLGNIKYQ